MASYLDAGPTGKFPDGKKLKPDDKGELAVAIAADHKTGMVTMYFGTSVTWMCLPPADALKLSELIAAKARELT